MATSISNISLSVTTKVTTTSFVSNKKVFANGEIMLNGKRVNIGGSLESAKRKINQISKFTGIRADIKNNGNKQRLVLVSFGNNVNINDPKKLLLNLYKAGKINNSDDSFIQVINKNKHSVKINYTTTGSNSKENNLLKNAFNGSDNIKYIKNSAGLVNPLNAINEINPIHEDNEENHMQVPEAVEQDLGYDQFDDYMYGDAGFDFSFSATDILWGMASVAYEVAKETIDYGYNTASSYLFKDD